MDIKRLFSGVAVVIDDQINKPDSKDLIHQIVKKLDDNNIPMLKYEYVPDSETFSHFQNINFVLLDWELFDKPVPGAPFDEEIHINAILDFISRLKGITFLPIFIFTRLKPDGIIEKLEQEKLYKKDDNNYIFVKQKDDLIENDKLFEEIENWLKQTPSIYVLKEWEYSLSEARNKLFWDFYNINHKWPSVLQKTFTDDGSDVNYELGNFIFKNIMARTEPIKFDENILKIEDKDLKKDEIRKVLEAERFLDKKSLSPKFPMVGDLFEIAKYEIDKDSQKEKKKLFVNIRPDCDIIRDKDNVKKGCEPIKNTSSEFNPTLYCLECEIIKDNDVKIEKGSIIERKDSIIIPFVYKGKILKINLNKIIIFQWKQQLFSKNGKEQRNFNETRVGRILPPYITAIQQKYAFYLQRQGLPAIPEKAIEKINPSP